MLTMLLILSSLLGCTPSCDQVCDRLTACEQLEPAGTYSAQCEVSCKTQETLYDTWEDTQLQDSLEAHRICIMEATCDELLDGVCYDENPELFIY